MVVGQIPSFLHFDWSTSRFHLKWANLIWFIHFIPEKIRSCRFLSRFPEFLLFQPGSSRGHEHDYERMHLGAIERRSAEQNQQGEMLPEIGIELAPNWPELEATQMGLQEDIRKPTKISSMFDQKIALSRTIYQLWPHLGSISKFNQDCFPNRGN